MHCSDSFPKTHQGSLLKFYSLLTCKNAAFISGRQWKTKSTQKQNLGAIMRVQYQIQKWARMSRASSTGTLVVQPWPRDLSPGWTMLVTVLLSVLSGRARAQLKISKKWHYRKKLHQMYLFHGITQNVSVWEFVDFRQGKLGKGTSWPWEIRIILRWEPSSEKRNRASFQQKKSSH